MNPKTILSIIFIVLLLAACSAPPAEEAASPVIVNQIVEEAQVETEVEGPSATAEIVVPSQPSSSEPYPEPESVDGGYPAPEAAAGYPAPENGAEAESAIAVDVQAPDIAGTGDVDVVFVSARETTAGVWSFSVTLEHPDSGWEDYADGWDVVLPDGTVIKPKHEDQFTRLLLHPHENEQPFTRSQSGIEIPAEVTTVFVRGHETVEGYGSTVVEVDLNAPSGDRFEVLR